MGTTYDLLVIRHQLFRKDNKQQTHDESIGFNETNGSQQITTLNGATEYPDSKLVNGTTEKHIDMEMVNKKTFDKPQSKYSVHISPQTTGCLKKNVDLF